MIREVNLVVLPHQSQSEDYLKKEISQKERIQTSSIDAIQIVKRSIDARRKLVKFNLRVRYYLKGEQVEPLNQIINYRAVSSDHTVHIIGAGPAGLFAALRAIELGIKPIVWERGKAVKERRRDLAKLNKEMILNTESNYCFGEGGAGTFSDGKLYTRSKKRGIVKKILNVLVQHGADENILVNAHPHIGTNKLPKLIEEIRNTILTFGGEINFNSKITDITIKDGSMDSININGERFVSVKYLILATGHSARDVFKLLHKRDIEIEAKPFALGVRIEHSQKIIDSIQYKCDVKPDELPPAPYSLVEQVKSRGVYSFCMCPGGIVAPCATDKQEVVTNGWSPSKRNGKFSNSGIVVEVREEDFESLRKEYGPLAAMEYQRRVEYNCWLAGGKSQIVPAQRMVDFIKNKKSLDLPETSYHPGIKSVNLHTVLPKEISDRLAVGLKKFGDKMKGFLTNSAVLHAPESRTSSPVRIPREKNSFEHTQVKGLYPCGEGAGYAGGIVSAAIDGEQCINKLFEKYIQ